MYVQDQEKGKFLVTIPSAGQTFSLIGLGQHAILMVEPCSYLFIRWSLKAPLEHPKCSTGKDSATPVRQCLDANSYKKSICRQSEINKGEMKESE